MGVYHLFLINTTKQQYLYIGDERSYDAHELLNYCKLIIDMNWEFNDNIYIDEFNLYDLVSKIKKIEPMRGTYEDLRNLIKYDPNIEDRYIYNLKFLGDGKDRKTNIMTEPTIEPYLNCVPIKSTAESNK